MTATVCIHRHGYFGRAFTPDLARCRASVPDGGRSVMFHQCAKKAAVYRDVVVDQEEAKGVQNIGFCAVHDPVKVAEKRAAQDAAYRAETAAREARDARKFARPKEYVEVLRAIAAGHNDPRAAAREVLEKWGDTAPEGN